MQAREQRPQPAGPGDMEWWLGAMTWLGERTQRPTHDGPPRLLPVPAAQLAAAESRYKARAS